MLRKRSIFITIPYFPLKSNTIAIWLIWPVSATIRSPWWSEGSLPHNHNLCAQSKVHCLLWSNTAQCIFRVLTYKCMQSKAMHILNKHNAYCGSEAHNHKYTSHNQRCYVLLALLCMLWSNIAYRGPLVCNHNLCAGTNKSERPVDALAVKISIYHPLTTWNQEMLSHLKNVQCMLWSSTLQIYIEGF